MGVAGLYYQVFLPKLKNCSGSISIHVLSKSSAKYKRSIIMD
jgi:hypothetical protein